MPAGDEFRSWEPRELGLPRALLIAILLVAAVTAFGVWISSSFGPKAAPSAIQVVHVTLAQLPQPAPPAPPAPPKPVPPPPHAAPAATGAAAQTHAGRDSKAAAGAEPGGD